MTNSTKNLILYAGVIIVLYLILRTKQTAVVTASLGSYDKLGNPSFPNDNKPFDYAVCGISADIIKNGLPIRVCIDPDTGKEYSVEQYPKGDYGQVVYLH
jgi:hypothetical protein